MEETKAYIAYKGFTKDLKSGRHAGKEQQYMIGETYVSSHQGTPKTCTSQGFHYCDTLEEVIEKWYNRNDDRYCKIMVLGDFSKDPTDSKCITTKMKILEEIPKEEIQKIKQKIKDSKIEKNINLEFIKEIQTKFPHFHVGGSAGLFLQGLKLKRLETNPSHDLDVCSPYYSNILSEFVNLAEKKKTQVEDFFEEEDKYLEETWGSGNDFDECVTLNYQGKRIVIDLKIDPSQKYRIVEYKGFKYKVTPWEIILEAKIKYAQKKGGSKHRKDLEEMLGIFKS
jgi:hypothetical protein